MRPTAGNRPEFTSIAQARAAARIAAPGGTAAPPKARMAQSYTASDIEVLEGLEAGDEVVSGPYQVLRNLKEWDHIGLDEKRQSDDSRRLRKRR